MTDEGVTGIGEARSLAIPTGVVANLVEGLKALLVGCSPFDVELLFDKMYRRTQTFGQRGLAIIALSGIELALWDIIGKIVRQPVYNLVGGCCNRDIIAYASLRNHPSVASAVDAAQHYIDLGFKAIKFHQREVESTKALRRAVGDDIKIMLDVSGLWAPDEAIRRARELVDCAVT